MKMNLKQIRHALVLAAQNEYDRRIERGIHPYSMASYHFDVTITKELKKHIDYTKFKKDDWTKLNNALCEYENNDFDKGRWAVSACLTLYEAWATPGFAEAYSNSVRENN